MSAQIAATDGAPPHYNDSTPAAERMYWMVKEGAKVHRDLMVEAKRNAVEHEKWRPRYCKGCGIAFCNADRRECPEKVMTGQICYEWRMDEYRKAGDIGLTPNKLTLSLGVVPPKLSCATALGSSNFSSGAEFWAIRIDALGDKAKQEAPRPYEIDRARARGHLHDLYPGNVTVGVSWDVSFDAQKLPGHNSQSVGFDGAYLIHDNVSKDPAEGSTSTKPGASRQFKVGDVVGIMLDIPAKKIAFFLNGAQVCEADVPPTAAYFVPLVGLQGKGDRVTIVPSAPMHIEPK